MASLDNSHVLMQSLFPRISNIFYLDNIVQCFFLFIIISSHLMQNDDEDIVYMYTGYTHKLMMCFISHPTSRDKVRGLLH